MNPESSVLRTAAVRITRARLALLRRLRRVPRAQSAAELHDAVGGDLVTVYRNLSVFTSAGIAREIRLAGTSVLYENAGLRHHHHAVCTKCGKVAELPECTVSHVAAPGLRIPGFSRVIGHVLEYAGLCNACD